MARHRPAAEGGYQRGEETRLRIVEAAIALFGERGYDGASTREIASAAGVNAPAIQYYFDGKEGVYLECVEHLIERLWQRMGPAVEAAHTALADPHSSDPQLIEISLQLLSAVLASIQDSPQNTAMGNFLERHQAGLCPPSATQAFETRFKVKVSEVIRLLTARIAGLAADDERTVIHAMALFTQGLAFRIRKPGLLAALKWTSIDQAQMERVRDVVLTQARFTLEGLARQKTA